MKKTIDIIYIIYFSIMSVYYSARIILSFIIFNNNEIDSYTAFVSVFTCIVMLMLNILPIVMILINRKWSFIVLFIVLAQFILGDVYAMINHSSIIAGIINFIICSMGCILYYHYYRGLSSKDNNLAINHSNTTVRYCRKCGAALPNDSYFCTRCGETTDFTGTN